MFGFLGLLFTLVISIKLFTFLINLLLSQYGRKIGLGVKWKSDHGEYVVVAGATGQLGSEYAREFASMAFNLVLISKNDEKLRKMQQDLKEKYPEVKDIQLVHVDFSKPNSVEQVKGLLTQLSPIAALVNCMGISFPPRKFSEYPPVYNFEMLHINVVAPLLMIEMVLPKMIEQNRGIIINLSSQTGHFRFPYYSTFSSCKSFISVLSEILSVEYQSKGIVVQCVEPLFVHSTMSAEVKQNFFLISPALSVFAAMKEVGIETCTYGHWKHKLSALALSIIVFCLGSRLSIKVIGKILPYYVHMTESDPTMDVITEKSSKIEDDDNKRTGEESTKPIKSDVSESEKTTPTPVSGSAPATVAINMEKSNSTRTATITTTTTTMPGSLSKDPLEKSSSSNNSTKVPVSNTTKNDSLSTGSSNINDSGSKNGSQVNSGQTPNAAPASPK